MISIYRKRKHGPDSTWKFTTFQRVNFRKSDILSGLTEENVIGSGGSGKVYRVVVNDSNNFVAVKRIWNNRKLEQKLEKEFHAEVKKLGLIRHSNIVKLLCYSSWGCPGALLHARYLSQNKISGPIPEKLGNLACLTVLDLSENQLSGQIPLQLGLLKLTLLNLSSNHLTGRIPTQFENDAYASSFLNNPALCANKPSLNINSCNNSDHHKSSKFPSKYLPLIISLGAAALKSLVVAMISIYRKRKHGPDSTRKFTTFQRVNFRKSDILSGLTEENVIGSGGSGKVYRVVVNDSNNFVAVKRIWNNRKLEQKLEKEFHAEVKKLGSIRHSNIVKLLCCMSNENSKLLVYEYSKNHSLDQWLHRNNGASSTSSSVQHIVLDWPKRLQIAVRAAQGLYYMHHSCSPPIVHRDVKSSNILLDSDFNAKVADFGLAKMFKQGELATMSVVDSSFGYTAPEYAHTTRVNEKIDVYSFGVILLELTTGKEASYRDEHTSLAEWAWRYIKDDIPIVDALDEEIKEPSYLDEMSSVFNLGINCTNTEPSKRPSMKEVVQILHKCNQPLVCGDWREDCCKFVRCFSPPQEFKAQ
ncbi:hypothetical protein SO802_010381 [Lithocarpus litseifolius]|uniref:Protein kinase domain-containing protein n=1 Tax=Lithocarpus litseifolius TaxID=425828 RepID=A0AAW2DFA1_9ROSI